MKTTAILLFTASIIGGASVPAAVSARPVGLNNGCTVEQIQTDSPSANACFRAQTEDVIANRPLHYLRCSAGGKMECCQKVDAQTTVCTPVQARTFWDLFRFDRAGDLSKRQ